MLIYINISFSKSLGSSPHAANNVSHSCNLRASFNPIVIETFPENVRRNNFVLCFYKGNNWSAFEIPLTQCLFLGAFSKNIPATTKSRKYFPFTYIFKTRAQIKNTAFKSTFTVTTILMIKSIAPMGMMTPEDL